MIESGSRRRLFASVLALAGIAVALPGCIENRGTAGPNLTTRLTLRLRPQLDSVLANTSQSRKIARMQVEVRYEYTGEVLLSEVQQIDPEEPDGQPVAVVELEVPTGDEFVIDGDLRLVGENDDIQWSGVFGPVTVDTHTLTWTFPVEMGRGDLSNLSVTNISVAPLDGGLTVGDTVTLAASVGGGGHDLVVFWGSLHPSIVTVDSAGTVTGISPGQGTIVAVAGMQSATQVVQVLPGGDAASSGAEHGRER